MTLDTPPESVSSPDGEPPDVEKLIATLFEKGFADLFADPEIRSYCLRGLKGAGCPPPTHHVAFYCLTKLMSGAGRFGEQALRNRLVQIAKKWPKVRAFLNGLVSIDVSKENAVALKKQLLADMGRAPTAEEMQADETQALEVVIALHNREMISGLSDDIRQHYSDIREELQGVCDAIDDAFASFTDVILKWEPLRPGQTAQNAIRYNAETFDFLGREEEMGKLGQFLAKPDMAGAANKFRWLLITGDGGTGKTRLAYEFHKSLQSGVWMSGRLDRAQLEKIVHDQSWQPRRPTLIIIDYPAQFPSAVHNFLSYLKLVADDFEFPVRVLLLERDARGEWYKTVSGGSDPALKGAIWLPDQHDAGWPLPPVLPDAIVQIMANRFERAEFNPPSPNLLIKSAFEVDPQHAKLEDGILPLPRPLFAAAVAELGIERLKDGATNDDTLFEGLNRETVLSGILERERRQKWRDEPGVVPADFEPHENLLALATLCRGLLREALPKLDVSLKNILPGTGKDFECTANDERLRKMGSPDPGAWIKGVEPDILGGYFLLDVMDRLDRDGYLPLFLQAAYEQSEYTAYTAFLAFRDFPQKFLESEGFFPGVEAGIEAARRYAGLGLGLTAGDPVEKTNEVIDHFFDHLDDLQTAYLGDRAMALAEAKAAFNVTSDALKAGDWSRVVGMLDRLDALRAALPNDREIALAEAKAAFNVTNDALKAGDWSRVDGMLVRLDALRAAFPDDREIAFREAKAAFNVTNGALKAGDWSRVDGMLVRLDALRAAFPDDREIALEEA
ncbi:MAG: ATP-binding protein, partial [Pseudomonadota bacterium]